MTWEDRADLAEASVSPACELARLVRGADAGGVARFIAALPQPVPQEVEALLVVLAAMVPPGSPAVLLSWADGAEPGPERYSAAELRAGHAQAKSYRTMRRPVPLHVATLENEYHRWRLQVRRWREARNWGAHGAAA